MHEIPGRLSNLNYSINDTTNTLCQIADTFVLTDLKLAIRVIFYISASLDKIVWGESIEMTKTV